MTLNQLRRLVHDHLPPIRRAAFWKGARSTGQVPTRVSVLLKYASIFNSDAVAAPSSSYAFRSSLFDPDVTGAGSQPNGFDQWMAFYNYFMVSRIRVKFPAMSEDHSVAFAITPSISAVTSFATALGNPRTKHAIYAMGGPAVNLDSGWVSLTDFFGVTLEEMRAEARYWGTSSANPGESLLMTILSAAVDGGSTYNQSMLVEVEFEAEFFDRVTLAPS